MRSPLPRAPTPRLRRVTAELSCGGRAELEALLQVKIEVSTDLREKLKLATEEAVDLRKEIAEQQEKIAHLDLRLELHNQPTEMTRLEVVRAQPWSAARSRQSC